MNEWMNVVKMTNYNNKVKRVSCLAVIRTCEEDARSLCAVEGGDEEEPGAPGPVCVVCVCVFVCVFIWESVCFYMCMSVRVVFKYLRVMEREEEEVIWVQVWVWVG
jgi:hypothetical protein